MESRRVTSIEVNARGYVTRLYNETAEWSPQAARDVILDLECGTTAYHVDWAGEHLPIVTQHDAGGTFLATKNRSKADPNGLLRLPRVERA